MPRRPSRPARLAAAAALAALAAAASSAGSVAAIALTTVATQRIVLTPSHVVLRVTVAHEPPTGRVVLVVRRRRGNGWTHVATRTLARSTLAPLERVRVVTHDGPDQAELVVTLFIRRVGPASMRFLATASGLEPAG